MQLLNRLSLNGSTIQYVYFDVPLGTAKERNAQRSGRERVPDSVIERMYWSFSKPAANVMVIDENGKEVIKEEAT